MAKPKLTTTERVVLTADFDYPEHGDQRVFRAGAHTLPHHMAAAARAAGLVAESDVEPEPEPEHEADAEASDAG